MNKKWLLISSVLLSITLGFSFIGEASAFPGLLWIRTTNPSGLTDIAFGVAVRSTGVYVVGYDMVGGNARWRIERRHPTTGALITFATSNPSVGTDIARSVVTDGTGIYVAGYDSVGGNFRWRIEKRNLYNLALIWVAVSNPSAGTDWAFDIAVRATGVYVVGCVANTMWRIERRSLINGALLAAPITANYSPGMDIPYAVAVDGTGVYVAGFDSVGGNARWRVEKRNLFNLAPIWSWTSNPSAGPDIIYDIAVTANGLYAVGYDSVGGDARWRMERRSFVNGAFLATAASDPSIRTDMAYGVAVGPAGVYVVGFDNAAGNNRWRIEKRNPLGLAFMGSVTINPSVRDDTARSVCVDTTGFYTVGYDGVPVNSEWRMEKRTP